MLSNCAGVCVVDKTRIEFQVIALEYIPNKLLMIEAICLNQFKNEATFKLTTKQLLGGGKKLEIAFGIINSVIKEAELDETKLYKLCIRNKKLFHITLI